jgi:hypothetical protein
MRRFGAWGAASIVGLAIVLLGFAAAGNAQGALQLTNSQLDNVTAGINATGSGTGAAEGGQSSTAVSINTLVGSPGPGNASAIGQVMATALSSGPGALATASSTLSLTLVSP